MAGGVPEMPRWDQDASGGKPKKYVSLRGQGKEAGQVGTRTGGSRNKGDTSK